MIRTHVIYTEPRRVGEGARTLSQSSPASAAAATGMPAHRALALTTRAPPHRQQPHHTLWLRLQLAVLQVAVQRTWCCCSGVRGSGKPPWPATWVRRSVSRPRGREGGQAAAVCAGCTWRMLQAEQRRDDPQTGLQVAVARLQELRPLHGPPRSGRVSALCGVAPRMHALTHAGAGAA